MIVSRNLLSSHALFTVIFVTVFWKKFCFAGNTSSHNLITFYHFKMVNAMLYIKVSLF